MPAILTAPSPAKIAAKPQPDSAARAAAEQHHLATRTVAAAQNAKAHAVRLERLGRRDPAIKRLIEERAAYLAAADALGAKHTALEAKHTELSAEFSRVAKEKADLEVANHDLKTQLAAALKPKR